MSWEKQHEIRNNPEQLLSKKEEYETSGSWQERYEDITLGQIRKKLEYSPELREKLNGVNPDDERTIRSLAEVLGEDETILAAIAFALRQGLIGTH